jgi:hypothetical protein
VGQFLSKTFFTTLGSDWVEYTKDKLPLAPHYNSNSRIRLTQHFVLKADFSSDLSPENKPKNLDATQDKSLRTVQTKFRIWNRSGFRTLLQSSVADADPGSGAFPPRDPDPRLVVFLIFKTST